MQVRKEATTKNEAILWPHNERSVTSGNIFPLQLLLLPYDEMLVHKTHDKGNIKLIPSK